MEIAAPKNVLFRLRKLKNREGDFYFRLRVF
jgi:hypothetical protein